ncbi:MFS transporter [Pusillimonas sp. SM2304]|uniref:MFS transporter n=1 Tax=Pusillimonas sp. SM2304 TaxID=3073241 RepID=UPI0028745E10|nr:MFS transporter [Pusillimonas sp. SM2304]MDS1140615.1 MFS transporter [Pusillimonas sp. SM2304]
MVQTIGAFFSLYLATVLLLVGSGLFNTYLGLRLTALSVSELWVGGLIAIYYLGLVFGARIGHKIIIQVGHIRAYAATAAIVTATVLALALVDSLWIWLGLRFLAGIAMVTQFMVLESWLNEQTENHQRGRVFAFYMVCSSLGTVLGQLSLTLFPQLNYQPLIFVAMCSAMCLVPVALTRRLHPALQLPAPLHVKYYVSRVPLSLTVLFVAGAITGAFYGLAPVYAVKQGLSSSQVAVFLAASVASGVVAQWPLGWLADRINRVAMIRVNAIVLAVLAAPLWGWWTFPYWALILFSCGFGVLQFTLYPLGAAFANDNVEPERRVGLSAILYMVYGVGACVGPLIVGLLMRELESSVYFVFVSLCAVVLVAVIRPQRVKGDHLSQDAPTQFVPMADTLHSSDVVATLDPRVDVESDISFEPVEPETATPPVDPVEPEPVAPAGGPAPSAGDQDHDGADGQDDAQRVDQR